MMASIVAAREGAYVTLFEGGDRVGKKILSTGNGKCNLSNLDLDVDKYYCRDKEKLAACLESFDAEDAVRFFASLGMLVKSKGGYLYPASEQASTVLDVLRCELKCLHVNLISECKISSVRVVENGRQIEVSDGRKVYLFDKVIIACGGKAAPKTGSDGSGFRLAKQLGHKVIPTVPALVQLTCQEDYLKSVSGVRCEGEIKVWQGNHEIISERGEIQLTDYGISGIPVFQISRVVNYLLLKEKEIKVVLNLMPDYDDDTFDVMKAGRNLLQNGKTTEEFFTGLLNKKIMMLFVKMAGLKLTQPIEEADPVNIKKVYDLCRHWELHVNGNKSFDHAQVCAGGVDFSELTKDMESRLVPGIFFAGEIIDVDGLCGGYNLHWAWCSAYLSGMAATKTTRN